MIVGILILAIAIMYPVETGERIEFAKLVVSEGIKSAFGFSNSSSSTSTPPAASPHLWESMWNGQVLASPGLNPGYYDYQYDELQAFFIDRAKAAEARRQSEFDYHEATGPSLSLLVARIQQRLAENAGIVPHRSTMQDLSVTRLEQEPRYSLFRVKFRDASGLSVEGLLGKPTSCSLACPVLIAPNGWSSAPEAIMGIGPDDYQHQFGKVFANSGYVVFAVYVPSSPYDVTKTNIAERNAWLLANISGTRYWSYWWLDKVMSAIDYVETLDYVDMTRVGIYGVSMGGQAALYSSVLDPRISAVVVSGTNVLTPSSSMLLEERRLIYPQDYRWDVADTPDTDELILSLFPRPVCVELDKYDTTGDFSQALQSAEDVQRVYKREGIADRFMIAVVGMKTTQDGHEAQIVDCKGFLDAAFGVARGPQ